jgi:hypothetical protein
VVVVGMVAGVMVVVVVVVVVVTAAEGMRRQHMRPQAMPRLQRVVM